MWTSPDQKYEKCGIRLVLIALAGLVVTACGQPFDTDLMTQVSDRSAPAISITTPRDGSSYAAVVLVEGTISDSVTDGGEPGQAVMVDYQVLSTSISGSTTIADDGTFSFSFETTGLSGSLTVRIAATDWNANEHEELITLVNEGAVPSFMAVPGNQTVTLSWDDVPLAESYAVRYADTGRVPTQTSGILVDNASSPLTITGLDNGGEYSFLLEARHDAESSSWSEIEQTIPLSTATLVPQASAGFGRITVNWQGIEGADEYELFRATSPGGQYTQLTGARASTSFTDFDVVDGTRYFYAVRPAGQTRILSGPAASETTPFPESAVELVSSQLGIFNTGQSIAIDGDYAYVGEFGAFFTSFADLRIYDITIPRSPVELSRLNVHGSSSTSRIRDVEVSGTTVYLTSSYNRIHVVDVSDRTAPVETAEIASFTSTQAIEIHDGFAYIADLGGGLQKVPADTLDDNDLSSRVYDPAHDVYDVVVSEGYAYIAAGAGGLEIVDLATLTTVADSVAVPNAFATSLVLVGDTVYLGLKSDGGGTPEPGLAIVDVGTVGSSSLRGRVNTGRDASDVSVVNGRAYLSDGESGLTVVDVNDPVNPVVVTENAVDEQSTHTTIEGEYLYNVGNQGTTFSSFRVNPYPQPVAGSVFAPGAGRLGTVHNGVIIGLSNTGTPTINAHSEAGGTLIDSFTIPDDYSFGTFGQTGVVGHGNHVFSLAADSLSGTLSSRIDAFRVDSPGSVSREGTLTFDGLAAVIVTRGDYAYVGAFNSLLVVDISDPASMKVVGFEAVPDFLTGLAWAGDTLLGTTWDIAGSDSQVVSFDLSLPESPDLIDSVTLLDTANWIGVSGDTAMVGLQAASETNDLQTVDVGDPRNLVVSGSAYDLSGTQMLFGVIQGNYLYAGTGSAMDIMDIRNPAAPLAVTTWATDTSAPPVIFGDTAYFSNGGNVFRARLLAP